MNEFVLGKQIEGTSPFSIKKMALQAFSKMNLSHSISVADIGAGNGEFTKLLLPLATKITMIDDFEASLNEAKVKFMQADLNKDWHLGANLFDCVFALEVIEHLENPRHFMRELTKIIKPGGYGFISTPNNHNIFSKLLFLFIGEHRSFQDNCYPRHITPILKKDFLRLLCENNLEMINFFYNYEDVIPKLSIRINFKAAYLSNSIGVLFKKNV